MNYCREIQDSTSTIYGLSAMDDFSMIAAGGAEQKVRIYKKENDQFNLLQTITVGINIKFLALTK